MRTVFDAASRYQLDESGLSASRVPQESSLYTLHIVRDGDTIENLAHRLLGDHSRWWEIVDLNPQLVNVLNLSPGVSIRIPT